jgi:hypothetical protein
MVEKVRLKSASGVMRMSKRMLINWFLAIQKKWDFVTSLYD